MEKSSNVLRDLGRVIDNYLEEVYGVRMGFSLQVFPFGNPGSPITSATPSART